MPNHELQDILASMEQIVRQAYALGRGEALKQVIDVLKSDASTAPALALAAPIHEAAPAVTATPMEGVPHDPAPAPLLEPAKDGAIAAAADTTPWYRRPARSH